MVLRVELSATALIALATSVASISLFGRLRSETNSPLLPGAWADSRQTTIVSAMPVSAENDWSCCRAAAMVRTIASR